MSQPKPHTFTGESAFSALYDAQKFLREHGWSYGPCCGKLPIGLMYGNVQIAKWKNLTDRERDQCHGTMTGDMRNGPITIQFHKTAPMAGLRAILRGVC